jgi:hypothetical protein
MRLFIKPTQTIKKLKLDNLIIITAYNPMYGLSMINQLNEYLNITTVMTVWIQSINPEFTTLKNNFAKVDYYNNIRLSKFEKKED